VFSRKADLASSKFCMLSQEVTYRDTRGMDERDMMFQESGDGNANKNGQEGETCLVLNYSIRLRA